MDMDSDDDVREPDSVVIDKLIDNNDDNYDFEKILQQSIEQSKHDYEKQEQEILELIIQQEKTERLSMFVSLKQYIKRMEIIDKPNSQLFGTLLSIIEMYENGYITTYLIDNDEYEKIFKLISNNRLPKEELNNLRKIIIPN
jgi:hypothetical protein